MHGQVRGARRRSGVVRKRTVQGIPRIGELYRKVNDSPASDRCAPSGRSFRTSQSD